jgi:hypothetical protein
MAGLRLILVIVATGLGAGALGAVLTFSRLSKAPPPSPVSVAAERPEVPGAVIPPGWNLALVSRLSHVEDRLDQLQLAADAPPVASAEPVAADPEQDPVRSREQERAAQYEAELAFRQDALAKHAGEPNDAAWAGPVTDSMRDSLTKGFDGVARTTNVDCRSKTCIATLTFPTPSDALVSLRQSSAKLTVPGCSSVAAVPTPPTSAGPYDLSVIYTCR